MFLCKTVIPLLIGLGRSIGRFSADFDNPLTSQLYPPKNANLPIGPRVPRNGAVGGKSSASLKSGGKTFSNFRSIIPRSLSNNFGSQAGLIDFEDSDSMVDLSFRPSLRTDLMV